MSFVEVNQMTGMPVSDENVNCGLELRNLLSSAHSDALQFAAQEIGFEKTCAAVTEMLCGLGLCDDVVGAAMESLEAERKRLQEAERQAENVKPNVRCRFRARSCNGLLRSQDMSKQSVMLITQIWISTPVDYLKVGDKLKEELVATLLSTEGVIEVEHHSEINVRCAVTSESDAEFFCELAAIRSRVETVFRSYHVWPDEVTKPSSGASLSM